MDGTENLTFSMLLYERNVSLICLPTKYISLLINFMHVKFACKRINLPLATGFDNKRQILRKIPYRAKNRSNRKLHRMDANKSQVLNVNEMNDSRGCARGIKFEYTKGKGMFIEGGERVESERLVYSQHPRLCSRVATLWRSFTACLTPVWTADYTTPARLRKVLAARFSVNKPAHLSLTRVLSRGFVKRIL